MQLSANTFSMIFILWGTKLLCAYGDIPRHPGRAVSAGDDTAFQPDREVEVSDFFLIGAQKCGTSSLFNLIATHEEICGVSDLNFSLRFFYMNPHNQSYLVDILIH